MALEEANRVLKTGGVFVFMAPFLISGSTVSTDNVHEHYGVDSYNKYRVGTYRKYSYNDLLDLLRRYFDVNVYFGVDQLSGKQDAVFYCTKLN